MAKLFNRVAVATATTGTGTVTLGSALSGAFCTFEQAGASDGDLVTYMLTESSDFEIGRGTYTASGTTLSRDTVLLSKISGTAGTAKMSLAGGAEVRVIAAAEDIHSVLPVFATTDTAVSISSTTWTDTGITATITPQDAASRVLINIQADCALGKSDSAAFGGVRLVRDSTVILDANPTDATGPYGLGIAAAGATETIIAQPVHTVFVDSPATTSPVTYKLQARVYDTGSIDFQSNDTAGNGTSTILLQEIRG